MEHILPIGKFKAGCLRILSEIHAKRFEVVVTRRGVPLVRIIPYYAQDNNKVIGCMEGTAELVEHKERGAMQDSGQALVHKEEIDDSLVPPPPVYDGGREKRGVDDGGEGIADNLHRLMQPEEEWLPPSLPVEENAMRPIPKEGNGHEEVDTPMAGQDVYGSSTFPEIAGDVFAIDWGSEGAQKWLDKGMEEETVATVYIPPPPETPKELPPLPSVVQSFLKKQHQGMGQDREEDKEEGEEA